MKQTHFTLQSFTALALTVLLMGSVVAQSETVEKMTLWDKIKSFFIGAKQPSDTQAKTSEKYPTKPLNPPTNSETSENKPTATLPFQDASMTGTGDNNVYVQSKPTFADPSVYATKPISKPLPVAKDEKPNSTPIPSNQNLPYEFIGYGTLEASPVQENLFTGLLKLKDNIADDAITGELHLTYINNRAKQNYKITAITPVKLWGTDSDIEFQIVEKNEVVGTITMVRNHNTYSQTPVYISTLKMNDGREYIQSITLITRNN